MAWGVEMKSASGLGVNRVQEKLASGAGKKEGKTSFGHDNGITAERAGTCLADVSEMAKFVHAPTATS